MPVITRALEDSAMQTLPLLFSSQNSCILQRTRISDRAGTKKNTYSSTKKDHDFFRAEDMKISEKNPIWLKL
jgi:hypothetical protein